MGRAGVNQNSAPSGYSADGRNWTLLDTVDIVNGQLVVELSDIGGTTSQLRFMADAVRIQRIEGVLSAALVYQCADTLESMNEVISDGDDPTRVH